MPQFGGRKSGLPGFRSNERCLSGYNTGAIVLSNRTARTERSLKLSELKTSVQVLAEHLDKNEEFRAEWERTALARFIALEVLRHRTDRGWSQRKLGEVLGMTQPQVARLERGDVNPNMDTLIRVASGLGIELTINVTPEDRKPQLVTKRAQTTNAVGAIHTNHTNLLVAAG
jgi:ribosome-binding protein aMBF1 (putative translation factor)